MSIFVKIIGIAAVLIVLAAFLYGVNILFGLWKKWYIKGVNPLKKFHRNPQGGALTPAEQQALNVGAILAEYNHDFYDSLQTSKPSVKKTIENILSEWWEINSPEDAVKTLENLKNYRHSQIFNSILEDAATLLSPTHQFENLRQVYYHAGFTVLDREIQAEYANEISLLGKHIETLFNAKSEEEMPKIRDELFGGEETFNICMQIYNMMFNKYNDYVGYINNLKQTLPELKKNGYADNISKLTRINTTAWDMGRMVNVARYSYDCGYITASQAWEYIFHAHEASASCYTDWASFGKAYIIGRAMWGGEGLSLSVMMDTVKELLKNAKSPWMLAPLK